MLRNIIDRVINVLKNNGIDNVYSAFDNLPTEKKGVGSYMVVGVGELESRTPVYSLSFVYLPFKAEIEVRIVGGNDSSLYDVYKCFDESLLPSILEMTSMNCSLKKLTFKYDSNIQRIVLSVSFSANGAVKLERSEYEH